jgi:hypothetical protein
VLCLWKEIFEELGIKIEARNQNRNKQELWHW